MLLFVKSTVVLLQVFLMKLRKMLQVNNIFENRFCKMNIHCLAVVLKLVSCYHLQFTLLSPWERSRLAYAKVLTENGRVSVNLWSPIIRLYAKRTEVGSNSITDVPVQPVHIAPLVSCMLCAQTKRKIHRRPRCCSLFYSSLLSVLCVGV